VRSMHVFEDMETHHLASGDSVNRCRCGRYGLGIRWIESAISRSRRHLELQGTCKRDILGKTETVVVGVAAVDVCCICVTVNTNSLSPERSAKRNV
jgi:hypothetical protein